MYNLNYKKKKKKKKKKLEVDLNISKKIKHGFKKLRANVRSKNINELEVDPKRYKQRRRSTSQELI